MSNYKGKTIYMGIDVHKNSYSVSVICDKVLMKKDRLLDEASVLLKYCAYFRVHISKVLTKPGFMAFTYSDF